MPRSQGSKTVTLSMSTEMYAELKKHAGSFGLGTAVFARSLVYQWLQENKSMTLKWKVEPKSD